MSATKQQYRLQNLSCANCAAKFEHNVRAIPTVEDVQLNFGAAKITVTGDVTIPQLDEAGAFDGIKAMPVQERAQHVPFYKHKENIVALIALVIVCIAQLCERVWQTPLAVINSTYALAIIVGGLSIFKIGLQNLLHLQFDMKTLMTIAIIGAAIIGEWQEAAIVVFLFAVSEALEAYSMNKARRSIENLLHLSPAVALIKRSHGTHIHEVEVPTEQIEIGDVLIVKPGQKIAMDGIVCSGSSTVNQANITGESMPVPKTVGNEVFAGTLNEQGALEVEVTKRVEDTTLAKIINLVEEAQAEKAPSQNFVDLFAKYYTPIIILIALFIAIIPPLFSGQWQHWIYQGLAVLVVGCPCALVISTPVAIVTAIGHAAKQGVLIKGGVYLEELGRIQAVAFDKTGTLTKGQPEVTNIYAAHGVDEKYIIQVAAAVERHSQHPLARAILKKSEALQQFTTKNFQSVIGKGAYAQVNDEIIYVGSIKWIGSIVEMEDQRALLAQVPLDESVVAVASEKRLLGFITVADQLREHSEMFVQNIYKAGIAHAVMLTGDTLSTANAIASDVGIDDVRAELLPDQKLKEIEKLKQQYGKVAMVGDGVNDAPALAKANIGIAMGHAGTDAALETAHIALMGDDLSKIPYTIQLSKKTLRIIKQNIFFALSLKLLALILVIPGWLTLWIAIFADMGATILVVFNSLRLMKKVNKRE